MPSVLTSRFAVPSARPNHTLLALKHAARTHPEITTAEAELSRYDFEAALDFTLLPPELESLESGIWKTFSKSVPTKLNPDVAKTIMEMHTKLVDATPDGVHRVEQGLVERHLWDGNSGWESSTNKRFAVILKKLRAGQFTTAKDFSIAANIPYGSWRRIEAGAQPGKKYWRKIAHTLGISVDMLSLKYEELNEEEKFSEQLKRAPYYLMGNDIRLRRLALGWTHNRVKEELKQRGLKNKVWGFERREYWYEVGEITEVEKGSIFYLNEGGQESFSKVFGLEEGFYSRFLESATEYLNEKNMPNSIHDTTRKISIKIDKSGMVEPGTELFKAIQIVMGTKIKAVRILETGFEVTLFRGRKYMLTKSSLV
jgi:hypothetical protein